MLVTLPPTPERDRATSLQMMPESDWRAFVASIEQCWPDPDEQEQAFRELADFWTGGGTPVAFVDRLSV